MVLVLNSTRDAGRDSTPCTPERGPPILVQGTLPMVRSPEASGLETERRNLQAEGFSEGAIQTISQSRVQSTQACNNAKWRIFVRWCGEQHLDPHQTDVTQIVNFL